MRSRGKALLRNLSGGATGAAKMGPRAVSNEACHEDRGRERDECAPGCRFEDAASAFDFVRAGHVLDSYAGLRASNLD
jgi:hypothetical protein